MNENQTFSVSLVSSFRLLYGILQWFLLVI